MLVDLFLLGLVFSCYLTLHGWEIMLYEVCLGLAIAYRFRYGFKMNNIPLASQICDLAFDFGAFVLVGKQYLKCKGIWSSKDEVIVYSGTVRESVPRDLVEKLIS